MSLSIHPASLWKGHQTTIASAVAGAVRNAAAAYLATQLGSNPRIVGYRADQLSAPVGPKRWKRVFRLILTGTLSVANSQIIIPASQIANIDVNTGLDLMTPVRVLRIESADGTKWIQGWLGQTAGDDFIVSRTMGAGVGVAIVEGGLTLSWPSTLDGISDGGVTGSGTIPEGDYRLAFETRPSLSFGSQSYNALAQCYTFPNPPLSTIGSGVTFVRPSDGVTVPVLTRVTDPDNGARMAFYHHLEPQQPVWAPTYVAQGALDPTWRAEITAPDGDSQAAGSVPYGQPFWYAFACRLNADVLAGSSAVSLLDFHARDGQGENRGPSPAQFMAGGGVISAWRAWNTNPRGSGIQRQTQSFPMSVSANEWIYIIGRLKLHWDAAFNPYHQAWVAKGASGAPVEIINVSGVPIGFNEPSALWCYLKYGLYKYDSWTGDASQSRTMHTKGAHLWRDVTDNPALGRDSLLALARSW